MKFSKIFIFVFACFMALNSARAAPGNFFKDLEEAGQRVRDAIISAKPALDVIAEGQDIWNAGNDDDD